MSANDKTSLDHFVAFEPNVELSGIFIVGFIRSMWADDLAPLIKKYAFDQAVPDGWYPQQKWLDFMTELYHRPDALERIVSVGLKVGEVLPLPPEVRTLNEALNYSSQSLNRLHRGGYWGSHLVERVSPTHLRVTAKTPYADASTYGLYWGLARRFSPPGGFKITSSHASIKRYTSPDDPPLIIDITWQE